MRDPEKTKEQLMDEVHELRQRVVELEMSRTNHKQAGGGSQRRTRRHYIEACLRCARTPY